MIVARCPDCATTFRVTPEQLKARGGMVRCGQCKTVFNGLDALIDQTRDGGTWHEVGQAQGTGDISREISKKSAESAPNVDETYEKPRVAETIAAGAIGETAVADNDRSLGAPTDRGTAADAPADTLPLATHSAGLVAARETREAPGYSKWAERPLAGRDAGFDAPPRSPRWPALLFALLLTLGLLAQITHQFRGEIAARWPEVRPSLLAACAELGCDVPLPRQADLISIEGSELQGDSARSGLLVLQATLRNRAAFAQAYPALEFSLTDTQDRLVARRVLQPGDYLSAKAAPGAAFPANTDLGVKLWIDAKQAGAAGYRLYVFYP